MLDSPGDDDVEDHVCIFASRLLQRLHVVCEVSYHSTHAYNAYRHMYHPLCAVFDVHSSRLT
jgi:hypothetical protein